MMASSPAATPKKSAMKGRKPVIAPGKPGSNLPSPMPNANKKQAFDITEPETSSPFKKALFGDIFGTARHTEERGLLAIMYRARVQEASASKKQSNLLDEVSSNAQTSRVGSAANVADAFESDSEESDSDVTSDMHHRQQLAMTVRNWSSLEQNDSFIIHEGAVHALVALAGIDDNKIRRCVASALLNLASRKQNREELIHLGAGSGIIAIATQVRSRKIARLCALTLCNLSMHEKGEPVLAKEGAAYALVLLLGVKGQRLLPICVQALFNLTCVEQHWTGMERIVKALINIPQTGFDHMYYFVKALANCSRFSWMRSRLIEDGSIGSLNVFMASIAQRENREEVVLLVATCLRSLSDTPLCRSEMLAKGSMELLQQLHQVGEERARRLIVKTIHNLLQVKTTAMTLNTALEVIANAVELTHAAETLQYGAACIFAFTKELHRLQGRQISRILVSTLKLLDAKDPLTQYYAVASACILFFAKTSVDISQLEELMQQFVATGPRVTDPMALRTVAVVMAKLSQDDTYMRSLEKLELMFPLIQLLLDFMVARKEDMCVQESACVSICRIAMNLDFLPTNLCRRIADELSELLCVNDLHVLRNAVCSIRALGEAGLCLKELLSNTLFLRVADIMTRYASDVVLARDCCAVLAVFSYDYLSHTGLSADSVMSVLFQATNSEDGLIRELVATTLCNISIDDAAKRVMVDRGVVSVLGNLSGATSEIIQELCAKCICNLSSSTELHAQIIKQDVLKTMLMIALVRSVSHNTKQLCARALLNLLTEQNFHALKEEGALRIFATLSGISDLHTQSICSRGFLLSTSSMKNREDIVGRHTVIQSLFAMVKCKSTKTRTLSGLAICNLLACPVSQKSVIKAGALPVLKILATMEIEELMEATARVITSLAAVATVHSALLREPIVTVLVLFTQQFSRPTFECAIYAFSCLSQATVFRRPLIDKGCVAALVAAVVNGRVNSVELALEVCRCLCLLSFETERAEAMVVQGNVLLAMHAIYHNGTCSPEAAAMISTILRNLSDTPKIRKNIIQQDGFRLLGLLIARYASEGAMMCKAAVVVMSNLGEQSALHEELLEQGFMEMMFKVTVGSDEKSTDATDQSVTTSLPSQIVAASNVSDYGSDDDRSANSMQSQTLILAKSDVYFIASAIHSVCHTAACHAAIVAGHVVAIFKNLLEGKTNDVSRHEIICALSRLSSSKRCRQTLVDQHTPTLLVQLARLAIVDGRLDSESQCSLALGFLSDITCVKSGVVASFLLLSMNQEDHFEATEGAKSHTTADTDSMSTYTSTSRIGGGASGSPSAPRPRSHGSSKQRDTMIQQNIDAQGPKSLRKMLHDGVMSRVDRHGVILPTIKTAQPASVQDLKQKLTTGVLRNQELLDDIACNSVMTADLERRMLASDYSDYSYTPIESSSQPEPGGMAARTTLEEMPLPGLGADRKLDPEERISELVMIPIDQTPIRKEYEILSEYDGDSPKPQKDVDPSDRPMSRAGKGASLGTDHRPRTGSADVEVSFIDEGKRRSAPSSDGLRHNSPLMCSCKGGHKGGLCPLVTPAAGSSASTSAAGPPRGLGKLGRQAPLSALMTASKEFSSPLSTSAPALLLGGVDIGGGAADGGVATAGGAISGSDREHVVHTLISKKVSPSALAPGAAWKTHHPKHANQSELA